MKEINIVTKSLSNTIPRLFLDEKRTQQVLINLLTNAIKFSMNRSQIHVSYQIDKSYEKVGIKVTDTGVGISEKE